MRFQNILKMFSVYDDRKIKQENSSEIHEYITQKIHNFSARIITTHKRVSSEKHS